MGFAMDRICKLIVEKTLGELPPSLGLALHSQNRAKLDYHSTRQLTTMDYLQALAARPNNNHALSYHYRAHCQSSKEKGSGKEVKSGFVSDRIKHDPWLLVLKEQPPTIPGSPSEPMDSVIEDQQSDNSPKNRARSPMVYRKPLPLEAAAILTAHFVAAGTSLIEQKEIELATHHWGFEKKKESIFGLLPESPTPLMGIEDQTLYIKPCKKTSFRCNEALGFFLVKDVP